MGRGRKCELFRERVSSSSDLIQQWGEAQRHFERGRPPEPRSAHQPDTFGCKMESRVTTKVSQISLTFSQMFSVFFSFSRFHEVQGYLKPPMYQRMALIDNPACTTLSVMIKLSARATRNITYIPGMVTNISLLPHKDNLDELSPFPTKLRWLVLGSKGQNMSKCHQALEMDKCFRKLLVQGPGLSSTQPCQRSPQDIAQLVKNCIACRDTCPDLHTSGVEGT